MNDFLLAFIWNAVQVLVFSIVVAIGVLIVRKWLSGIAGDLLAVSMLLIVGISLLSIFPIPSVLPALDEWVRVPVRIAPDGPGLPQLSELAEHSNGSNGDDLPATKLSGALVASPSSAEVSSTEIAESFSSQLSLFWNRFAEAEISLAPVSPEMIPQELSRSRPAITWKIAVGFTFVGLVLIGFVRLVFGYFGVLRLLKHSKLVEDENAKDLLKDLAKRIGVRRRTRIMESHELTTPATVGWVRPAILLPSDWRTWSPQELSSSFAHELAHVANHDFVRNFVAQIAVALNFFNPLVHWLGRELRVSQELDADDVAAKVMGGSRSYLRTMAEMALNQDSKQLGWLAQPFLPTRKTFVRRIEMLKGTQKLRGSRSLALRWSARALVLLIAIGCIGLRLPESSVAVAQDQNAQRKRLVNRDVSLTTNEERELSVQDRSEGSAEAERLSRNKLAFVSNRTKFFVAFDFKALNQVFDASGLIQLISNRDSTPFVDLEHASTATLQLHGFRDSTFAPSGGLVVHYTRPVKADVKNERTFRYRGCDCFSRDGLSAAVLNGGRTLLLAVSRGDLEAMLDSGEDGPSRPIWRDQFKTQEEGNSILAAAVSETGMEFLNEWMNSMKSSEIPIPPYSQLFHPLYAETDFAAAKISWVGDSLRAHVVARAIDESSRENVEETAIALKVVSRNLLQSNREWFERNLRTSDDLPLPLLMDLAEEALGQLEIRSSENRLIEIATEFKIEQQALEDWAKSFVSNKFSQMEVTDSLNNVRQLQLAMLNYEDSHREWPAAAFVREGHRHSWRIAILPFIEQSELYEKYRFDEPWNSEHNSQVTATMPEVFRHPLDSPNSTNSAYYVATGEGTPFPDGRATGLNEISDGTSNTLMIFEAKKNQHWACPFDVPFRPGKMKGKLGGYFSDYVIAVTADGTPRKILTSQLTDKFLDGLLMSADGGLVSFPLESEDVSSPALRSESHVDGHSSFGPSAFNRIATSSPAEPVSRFNFDADVARSLQAQIIRVEIELTELRNRYGESHPSVKNAKQKVAALKEYLAGVKVGAIQTQHANQAHPKGSQIPPGEAGAIPALVDAEEPAQPGFVDTQPAPASESGKK